MPELVDFIVDGGILFNIGVRPRNVCLRLVVVVVRDEVFYSVFRKKFPELRTKLRR